jgi:hypothetical protein
MRSVQDVVANASDRSLRWELGVVPEVDLSLIAPTNRFSEYV